MRGNKEIKLIKAGRLIDGTGADPIKNAVLIIEGKRIKGVERTTPPGIPLDAEIIDATRYTVMPGMFDCHVHLAALNACSFSNYRVAMWEVTPQLQQFYTLYHAQRCFEMGFTTLRDMGRETPRGNFTAEICAVRDSINAGIVPGPRILACGRVVTKGSHHDLNLPRAAPRVPGVTGAGPWQLRDMAREYIRMGCDLIKICVSGGSSSHEDPEARNITQDELDAVVDEAHAFKKQCAAHCWTPESHRMCIQAHMDTIEHIVFTDDETISMIKDAGIPVTPTLVHRTDHAIEIRRRIGTPENVLTKMKRVQPFAFDSFQKMHQAGVKIVMGTDIVYDPEMGDNAMELGLYVKLGMTPMEAMQTATKYAAEALRLDADLGTVEAGKLADIIIVDGDPLSDIRVLQNKANIKVVMKEGQAFVDNLSAQKKYVIHPEPGTVTMIDK